VPLKFAVGRYLSYSHLAVAYSAFYLKKQIQISKHTQQPSNNIIIIKVIRGSLFVVAYLYLFM
jgi:hypothetical protein